MTKVDIAIVGGGLAGSTAAAMLGRAGIDATLIDPRPEYRPDFRCEKFDASQIAVLDRTGLFPVATAASSRGETLWIARYGRVLDRKPDDQINFRYETMVNALRAEARAHVPYRPTKAVSIEAEGGRQRVGLADGGTLSARLVVVASGLNPGLRHALGIGTEVVSRCHSISIGFDVAPRGRRCFAFPALTYYPERIGNRMAYITLFPVGRAMRVNLFVYRDMDDPWLGEMHRAPERTLFDFLPGLEALTGPIEVEGDVRIRPVDLTRATDHVRPGIVLMGDAFATSCPAAGTGAGKVLTDAWRLCGHHIPRWLATPGIGAAKIVGFYGDPEKRAADAFSVEKAFRLRSLSLEPGPVWLARRWMRFLGHGAIGLSRRTRAAGAAPAPSPAEEGSEAQARRRAA